MNGFFNILESFARERGFVKYQIDSYNNFIAHRIPKVIRTIGSIKPEVPELGILFQRFGIALGLGLMIGVEREREARDAFAGIRTFPLIALLGCAAGLMNDHFSPWSFAIIFVILSTFVLGSYVITGSPSAPGITTEIASLLAFLFGALSWWQMTELAAA